MNHLHICKTYLLGVADSLAAWVARATAAVAEAWRRHRDRMAEESSYAQAFVTVVIAAAEMATASVRIRSVVRELAAAYVAVLRALRPRFTGYGWDWPDET